MSELRWIIPLACKGLKIGQTWENCGRHKRDIEKDENRGSYVVWMRKPYVTFHKTLYYKMWLHTKLQCVYFYK